MNKKIMTALLATTSIILAKPYAGLRLGFSKNQLNTKFSGHDYFNHNKTYPEFSHSQKMSVNSLSFGLLAGTTFKINDKTLAFIEADYEYLGGKTTKTNLDLMPKTGGNVLADEHVAIRASNSFGFMPGVDFAFSEKVSGLFGLRFNMTQFKVRAFHVSLDDSDKKVVKPLHEKSKSKFLFGVEPTLGAAYKINDKIGARLTVGYNFMQSKKVIKDYIQTPEATNVDPDVTIKPRGFNVRLAMTYSF